MSRRLGCGIDAVVVHGIFHVGGKCADDRLQGGPFCGPAHGCPKLSSQACLWSVFSALRRLPRRLLRIGLEPPSNKPGVSLGRQPMLSCRNRRFGWCAGLEKVYKYLKQVESFRPSVSAIIVKWGSSLRSGKIRCSGRSFCPGAPNVTVYVSRSSSVRTADGDHEQVESTPQCCVS